MNFRKGSLLPLRPHQGTLKAVRVPRSVAGAVHGAAVIAVAVPRELRIPTVNTAMLRQTQEVSTHSVVLK